MRAWAGLIALTATGFLAGCQSGIPQGQIPPVGKMSLAQAEDHCVGRANVFARKPLPIRGENGALVGLLAEYPDDFQVQDFYKQCVRANSGQSTRKRVDWRL
jgi:hypothetical protein